MPNTYYVDNTLFDGHAEGTVRDAYPSTIQLAADASSENDAYKNYGIWIVSGTGAGQSRRITSYSGTTKFAVVSTWTITPDTTSVYEITVGADTNTGANEGTGSIGAFRTWQKALDTVAAGDTVNIKAGRAYLEAAALKTAGGTTSFVRLRGYKDTPGDWETFRAANPMLRPSHPAWDAYRAKMSECALTCSIVSNYICYSLESLWVDAVAGAFAFNLFNKQIITVRNCRASNSLIGFYANVSGLADFCCADGNGSTSLTTGWAIINSDIIGLVNMVYGGSIANCVIVGEVVADMALTGPIANNTLIGTGEGDTAIKLPDKSSIVVNNLMYRFATGIEGGEMTAPISNIAVTNAFFDVDTPRQNFPVGIGDIEGADPGFVDPDNGDYRLRYDSPARGKGVPAYMDIGALQRREVATHRPINLGVQV